MPLSPWRLPRAALLALIICASGCSEVDVTTVDVASVDVAPPSASVMVNATTRLTATVFGNGGERLTGRRVDWSSEDESIATVDGDGVVRGVSPGSTTIRATSEGAAGTATVNVGQGPAIALSAASASFAGRQGGADPAQQSIAITNAGGGTLDELTVAIAYADGQPGGWLTAELAGSTAPTSVSLRAAIGSLSAGTYAATVTVSSSATAGSAKVIDVTFVIGDAQPAIALSPTSLEFEALERGANPAAQSVQIANAGGGSLTGLTVSLTYPGGQPGGWLSATLGGTTAPATVTVAAQTGSLAPGTYTATIGVASTAAANSPQTVGVTFVVLDAPPVIAVSPTTVSVETTDVGGDPASVQVSVTNAGGGTLDGIAAAVTYASGQPTGWLQASLGGSTAPTTLTLSATKGELAAGTYDAIVHVSSPDAAEAQTVAVSFTIVSTVPPPPSAPGSLSAAPNTEGVRLSWSAAEGTVDAYVIERKTGSDGTYAVIDTVAGTTLAYQDTGLQPATLYGYRVMACNRGGCSAWSEEALAVTLASAPAIPANLAAEALSPTEVRLTWDAPGGQTHYEIQRKRVSGEGSRGWEIIATVAGDQTSYVDTNLREDTTYEYRIAACAATLCSSYSASVTVTTPKDG